jgi:hypothetical protein
MQNRTPDPAHLALTLARRILTDALASRTPAHAYVRDLAGRIGELQQAITSAVTVLDTLGGTEPGEPGQ